MNGWIKIHRKLLDWQWFDYPDMVKVWLYFLLSANHDEQKWHGINIQRGQLIIGRKELSKTLRLSEQSIRTCITRLKSTNEITSKSTNKYTIITILNYDSYQNSENEINQQINQQINQRTTNEQPANNHKQELKNLRIKENNIRKNFKPPTAEEVKTYFTEKGYTVDSSKRFYDYYTELAWHDSSGKKIINWKAKAQAVWFKDENRIKTDTKIKEITFNY